MTPQLRRFLETKVRALQVRARRLSTLDRSSVGLRPRDMPFAPSPAHFAAANQRLREIDKDLLRPLRQLQQELRMTPLRPEAVLDAAALAEREVDRARRAYGLFFEVFSQRGTRFAPALAACDAIAADCFQVVRQHAPGLLRGPLLKPVSYLESGFSPATFRRGVMLRRLLGEHNPFPLVRIPYERVESPWGMGVVLHEVGHNLHSDLGIWEENRLAVQRRVLQVTGNTWLTRIWSRWHKEIFADLIALLLGGPAAAYSMAEFLAGPPPRVLGFRPLGVHPLAFLRSFILAQMLLRMGFQEDAHRLQGLWQRLYGSHATRGRVPPLLLTTAEKVIPQVVDEVAYQVRRGLAQRTLADVIRFTREDQQRILRAARELARGQLPADLPARFAVSASRYAFEQKLMEPVAISRTVLHGLARRGTSGKVMDTSSETPGPTRFAA
jgi:hypothetical protein